MQSLTNAQKAAVNQFAQATGVDKKTAVRLLKNANFKLDIAADAYFGSGNGNIISATSAVDTTLNKMFDDIRDPSRDADADSIGVESVMNYLQQLDVNPESCEIFVVLDIVQASSLGEITRNGFVEGWRATNAAATTTSHRNYVKSQIATLRVDLNYFRHVYRHAFVAGKEPDQKALSLENALVFWDMMFSPPGMDWSTHRINWLQQWKSFLAEKWTRSVNRDMWNQTLEFAVSCMKDEMLTFWKEDGAWPSVIDDFVLWCREKGVVRAPTSAAGGSAGSGGEMLVDG